MTASTIAQLTVSSAGTVLHGVPVVAGVQYAPVIRPGKLPEVADTSADADLAETDARGRR